MLRFSSRAKGLMRFLAPRPLWTRQPQRATQQARLKLEALEDRTLPAITLGPPLVASDIPAAVAAGDFNGDGNPDLVTANHPGNDVSVFLGDGHGHFGPARSFPAGTQPTAVVAADFRGTGKLDLAVLGQEGVDVLPGNGDGTFAPPTTALAFQSAFSGPASLVVGNFGGHGPRDLAVITSYATASTVGVLLARGDGTFTAAPTLQVDFPATALAVTDFNRDGKADLAVAGAKSNCPSGMNCGGLTLLFRSATVFLGDGDGTFATAATVTGANVLGQPSLVVGDFHGNGRPDLVLGGPSGADVQGYLFPGNGDGSFGNPTALPISPLLAADFNGDGKTDLAGVDTTNNPGIDIVLGNGDGTFGNASHAALAFTPQQVVAADFNRDGKLDLAMPGGGQPSVTVLLGNGDGTLAGPLTLATSPAPGALAPADFNGDGKTDLAVVDQSAHDVAVLLSQGDGTFTTTSRLAAGQSPAGLATGDFNGDGKLDLAVTDSAGKSVDVFFGNGDGTFTAPLGLAVGANPGPVAAGDFLGNGQVDLAVGNRGDDTVSILRGDGKGAFAAAVAVAVPAHPTALAVGDFNGDGKLDLMVASSAPSTISPIPETVGTLSILLGNGDGSFAGPLTTPLAGPLAGFVGPAVGDFNGDGKLDLALIEQNQLEPGFVPTTPFIPSTLVLLLGNGDGTFTRRATPLADEFSDLQAADVEGNGKLDLVTNSTPPSGPNPDDRISIFPGNGDGTFRGPVIVAQNLGVGNLAVVPDRADRVALGNFRGGTRPDLLIAHEANGSLVLLPNVREGPHRTFVSQLYQDLLLRPADAAGLSYFGGQLDSGQATRLQVVQEIQASPEYRTGQINQIISRLLLRQAGPDDRALWLNFLNGGGTLVQMQALILGSAEYLRSRAHNDSAAFLTAAFRDVLNRDPTPAESQGFAGMVGDSAGRTQVALILLTSTEARQDSVRGLYQTFLQRAADSASLAFFTSALQQGATGDQVAAVLASSPQYNAEAQAGLYQAYVSQLYHDLLGRQAGPADLGYWTGLLEQELLTPPQVVQQIEASREYSTRVVRQAYQTFLHRAADAQGLASFTTLLGAGGSLPQVDLALAGSAEYFQQRGGGTADGFLQALYQDVLGRSPDAAGRQAFTQALAQGAGPADVAQVLFSSDEYRKDLVAQFYQEFLHRAAGSADLGYWANVLQQGQPPEQVLAAILSAEEYFARLA